MEVCFGIPKDIDSWMELVSKVSWNFPGLESQQAIDEHRNTVMEFIKRKNAICVKEDKKVTGVLLFSTENNMICFLAVDPDYRRQHIATMMFSFMFKIADENRDIMVTTFRKEEKKGLAARAFYKKFGFVEGELIEEFGHPSQVMFLPR